MNSATSSVTSLLSLGTVIGDILVVILFAALLVNKNKAGKNNAATAGTSEASGEGTDISAELVNFFGKHAVLLSFLIAAASMVGSLFYSDSAGFIPCSLCWWQRIFLYPQAFILLFAMIKKRDDVAPYSIFLSAIGGLISLYHVFLQFGGSPFVPCSAGGASCSQRYFLEFGYVTLPTMALTGFLMILVFMWADRQWRKNA